MIGCVLQLDDATGFPTIFVDDKGIIEELRKLRMMSAVEVYGVMASGDQFRSMPGGR